MFVAPTNPPLAPVATATLAQMLAALYPHLKAGADFTLAQNGLSIATWTPAIAMNQPTLGVVRSAYAKLVSEEMAAAKLDAALEALGAFWKSLTAQQQMPLLRDKATIEATLVSDTHAAVLLIQSLESGVTGLTADQTAKQTAALNACAELVS